MRSGIDLAAFSLLNLFAAAYVSVAADSNELLSNQPLKIDFANKQSLDNLLQLDFQHGTVTAAPNEQTPISGFFANGASWLPDENGISQSLRESIRQESLRILNQAFPNNQ